MSQHTILKLPDWCYTFDVFTAGQVFGSAVWSRGKRYFADGYVMNVTAQGDTLVAEVLGSGRNTYRVVITPVTDPRHLTTICSCPVGMNCKHAVCVLLNLEAIQTTLEQAIQHSIPVHDIADANLIPGMVTTDGNPPTKENTRPGVHTIAEMLAAVRGEPAPGHSPVPAEPQPPSWEQAFSGLTPSPEPAELDAQLAVVLDYESWDQSWTVSLHRSGKTAPWHKTPLKWESLLYRKPTLRLDEQQVAAVVRLRNALPPGYDSNWGSGYNLQAFGPDLWPALDECVRAGVHILHNSGLTPWQPVQLIAERVVPEVDVASVGNGLSLTIILPQMPIGLQLWNEDCELIGSTSHGVLISDIDEVTLAALATPLPESLHALFEQPHTHIPNADISRFQGHYLPVLAKQIPVTSSDNSITILTPAQPVLLIHISSPEDNALQCDVTFMYRRDELMPLGAVTDSERDRLAEHTLQQLFADLAAQLGLTTQITDTPHTWQVIAHGSKAMALRQRITSTAVRHRDWIVQDDLPAMKLTNDVAIAVNIGDAIAQPGETTDTDLDGNPHNRDHEGRAVAPVDWFSLSVEVTVAGHTIPIQQLIAAIGRGDNEIFLSSGVVFDTNHPDLEPLRALCERAADYQHDSLGKASLPDEFTSINPDQIGWFEQLQAAGIVGQQSKTWRERVHTLTNPPQTDIETRINATLRPYQQDGSDWLIRLWHAGVGGVLADDMGLGKTLQMLTLIDHATQHNARNHNTEHQPFLVVAPASVASAWAREAQKFAPHLRVVVISSTLKTAKINLEDIRATHDVVVTSYTVLRLDQKHYHQHQWNVVICDEAQFIKNPRSKTYAAVRKTPARSFFAITGTPVENSLMDLWSMLSLAAPGLFPDPERFIRNYRKPIEDHHNGAILGDLKAKIRPLVLRRTKDAVATDLPPKQEQVVTLELSKKHRQAYDVLLNAERQKILGLLDDLGEHRVSVLAGLTKLRLASLNPHLVSDAETGTANTDPIALTKINYLADTVTELAAEGHRVLIFSQFTSFLKTIRDRFTADNITWTYLDGQTRKRGDRIKEFTDGNTTAFLISLKAGGFGLTLTEADYVFVVDPWWNPAAEAQAIDRAHRIGQTKSVHVYRLVAADTIEEKVLELQQRKRDLYRAVVDDGTFESGSLTAADIQELLT